MSDEAAATNEKVERAWTWLGRVWQIFGIITFCAAWAAAMYLDKIYVSREDFDEDTRQRDADTKMYRDGQQAVNSQNAAVLTQINTTLQVMAEASKINSRQDESIKDHEARIRVLEQTRRN